MALNELFEITLDATLLGQDVSNVYFYRQAATFPAGLESLRAQSMASSFLVRHFPDVRAMMTPDVAFQAIRCRSLFAEDQSHTILLTQAGTYSVLGGSSLPSFNALSFSLKTDNAGVKAGRKRFAGINSGVVVDGIAQFVEDFNFRLNAVRDSLAANLTDTLTGLIVWGVPVVVKRIRTGTPGNYTYRLPANAGEAVYGNVTSADYSLLVTSQTSRRAGVGQ